MRIRIETRGIAEARQKLERLSAALPGILATQGTLLANSGRERFQALAPRRTGKFAGEIAGIAATSGNGMEVAVFLPPEDADLRKWLRDGTPAHTISARNVGTLAFQVGGRTVFRHSVNHPGVWGTKGNPHWEEEATATMAVPLAVVRDAVVDGVRSALA